MLPTIAEFPLSGSFAWTRPTCPVPGDPGDPESHKVRILEVGTGPEADRVALVAFVGLPPRDPALRKLGAFAMPASGNTRCPLRSLAATRDEALTIAVPPRGGGLAGSRARRRDRANALFGFAVILLAVLWFASALPGAPHPGEFVERPSVFDAQNHEATLP